MSERTSHTLIISLKEKDDDAAWERFSREYSPLIYSIIAKSGVGHEDCEELLQDVLVKVWKALGNFLYERQRCRFRTWLGTVTRNTALNFIASKSNRNSQRHIDNPELLFQQLSCEAATDQLAEREWQLFVSRKAWEKVCRLYTDKQLDAYSLMLEKKDAAAIASELDIARDTVSLYRSRVATSMKREIRRLNAELDG